MSTSNPAKHLYVVYLVAFIDMLGFGVIIPVVRDYTIFLVDKSNASGYSLGTNYAFLAGILMASYSFFQFLLAPFLGRLSDRYGRKPILFVSVLGNVISYILWAISQDYIIFLISRIISGATGANISVAQSYLADVTDEKTRGKYMGMMGALFGLGFILGPAIGGYLSQFDLSRVIGDFGMIKFNQYSLIGVFTAGLSLINLILIVTVMVEPLEKKPNSRGFKELANPKYLFSKLFDPQSGRLFLIYFIFYYSFVHLEASLAWDLKDRFFLDTKETGYFFAFMGIMMALIQGGLYRRIYNRMGERYLAQGGLFLIIFGYISLAFFHSYAMLFISFIIISIAMGISNPSFSTLASLNAPKEEQGLYLGLMQSFSSLARTIAPISATLLYDYVAKSLPFYSAAILAFIAFLLILPWKGKDSKSV